MIARNQKSENSWCLLICTNALNCSAPEWYFFVYNTKFLNVQKKLCETFKSTLSLLS